MKITTPDDNELQTDDFPIYVRDLIRVTFEILGINGKAGVTVNHEDKVFLISARVPSHHERIAFAHRYAREEIAGIPPRTRREYAEMTAHRMVGEIMTQVHTIAIREVDK